MRAPVPARTGRLAMAAGLAMALGAGLAPAAQASQPATAQAASRIPAAPVAVQPRAVKLLYNQNNDPGNALVDSDNFGNGNSSNDQAADDFAVPKGQTWTISKVYVSGVYWNSGTATSVTVFFYKNAVNKKSGGYIPGALVKKETLPVKDYRALFMISGITAVTLPAGRYWLSVQFNMKSNNQWFWDVRTAQNGSPAVYQNPSNVFGTGCVTWYNMQTCLGKSGVPDLMFGLYGSNKG